MAKIGYAGSSSRTQDCMAQVEALKTAGCEKIFSEKRTTKMTAGRREFHKLMGTLQPGDCLYVVKLDRLARSTPDLQNILHDLEEKGCGFVSLGESWCDTTTEKGRLMLTIVRGISRFERGLIRSRCRQSVDRAAARSARPQA